MKLQDKTVLVCDCEGTMKLDGAALAASLGAETPHVHHQLCRAQLDAFRRAVATGERLLIACTQEAPVFTEAAAEANPASPLAFANIREQAGWSSEGAAAGPKIAALL